VRRDATMRLVGEMTSVAVEMMRFADRLIGRLVHLKQPAAARDPIMAAR
jgi:hypothetical protein